MMARPQFVTLQPSVLESRLEFCSRSLQRPFLPVLSNSHRHRRSQHHLVVQASRQDDKSLSQLEREVPPEQRPVNELQELKESSLYSWVSYKINKLQTFTDFLYTAFSTCSKSNLTLFSPFRPSKFDYLIFYLSLF